MPCTRPLVLAIALNVGGLLAAPATAQTSRTVTRSISLARDGQVDPDTFTGSIDVTAWNQGRVKAKARVEGEGLRGSVQLETFSGDIELAPRPTPVSNSWGRTTPSATSTPTLPFGPRTGAGFRAGAARASRSKPSAAHFGSASSSPSPGRARVVRHTRDSGSGRRRRPAATPRT